jgi:HlyD family secretion protein
MTKKRRTAIGAVLLVIVALIVIVTVMRSRADGEIIEASGTVEATEADLGFQLPGRIDSIAVREGDAIHTGSALAWLDRTESVARKRAAEAQVASARARLTELQRGFRTEEIEQARAAFRAAEQRLSDAQRDLERSRRLYDGGAVSQQQLDNQRTALTLAESDHQSAREQLQLMEAGPRTEQIAAQRGILAQAEATVAQIDAALSNATIRAPFDGVITVRHREPGEIVPPGVPVLSLMNPDDRWIRIYVREALVGRLALGMGATINADAYPDRDYAGRIVFISDKAEFTPRNVQTTEERVKLVYRVKVQITEDPGFDLKPGLPADVRLDSSPP